MKKETFPPLPFYILGYKFIKVKCASKFVKELEIFHFGEKSFHRNDSNGSIAEYCAAIGIHYEYSNHFNKDEEVYRRSNNMTEMSKRFKKEGRNSGSKDSSSAVEKKMEKQKEEALKLQQAEEERKNNEEVQKKQEEDDQRNK